jgi:hypothetical protein
LGPDAIVQLVPSQCKSNVIWCPDPSGAKVGTKRPDVICRIRRQSKQTVRLISAIRSNIRTRYHRPTRAVKVLDQRQRRRPLRRRNRRGKAHRPGIIRGVGGRAKQKLVVRFHRCRVPRRAGTRPAPCRGSPGWPIAQTSLAELEVMAKTSAWSFFPNAEESVSLNSNGSTPRTEQTSPLQENDNGLTHADSLFVKQL